MDIQPEASDEHKKNRRMSIMSDKNDATTDTTKHRRVSDESRKSVRMSRTSRLSMRRQSMRSRLSYGFGSVAGLRPLDRTSQLGYEYKRPPLLFLNTYQVATSRPFHVDKSENAVNEILDQLFDGHKYNEQSSPALAMRIANEVVRKVRIFEFNRYRLVTVVTLAQRRAQSYNNAVAFLWDNTHDKYVNVTRNTHTAFIQITVFGIYLD